MTLTGPDGRPLMPQPQQAQLNIKPTELDDVICDRCGRYTFTPVFFMKRIPAIVSPTNKETFMPMQVFACDNCGHVNDRFIAGFGGWFKSTTPEQESTEDDGLQASTLEGLEPVAPTIITDE